MWLSHLSFAGVTLDVSCITAQVHLCYPGLSAAHSHLGVAVFWCHLLSFKRKLDSLPIEAEVHSAEHSGCMGNWSISYWLVSLSQSQEVLCQFSSLFWVHSFRVLLFWTLENNPIFIAKWPTNAKRKILYSLVSVLKAKKNIESWNHLG